jgi:hypothetical protein
LFEVIFWRPCCWQQRKAAGSTTRTRPLARIFCILILHRKKIHVWTLENFNVIFGPFTRRRSLWPRGNTARAIGYGAEVRAALAQTDVVAPTWYRARRHRSWRRALFYKKTCLAQLVKYKALNLVVVGLSSTVGVFLIFFVFITYLFFCCPYFSLMSLICLSWFISHLVLFLW